METWGVPSNTVNFLYFLINAPKVQQPILPFAPRRGRVRAKRRTQGMHEPHPRHFRANGPKAATARGTAINHTFFTATNPTSATTHPLSPSHFPPLSKGEIQRGSQGEGTGRPRG